MIPSNSCAATGTGSAGRLRVFAALPGAIALALCLGIACSPPEGVRPHSRLATGSRLAGYQDELCAGYEQGRPILPEEAAMLERNLWVRMAATRCPSNLVLRQWCLHDLGEGRPEHAGQVLAMVKTLTWGDSTAPIWAEGYGYWLYTRSALDLWRNAFDTCSDAVRVGDWVRAIDSGFVATAYLRGTQWYPAPFGDLADMPLGNRLQTLCRERNSSRPSLMQYGRLSLWSTPDSTVYTVRGTAIGLNTHVPLDTFRVTVVNGVPRNFRFYTGYANKYDRALDEWRDVLDRRRRRSVRARKTRGAGR